jgi:hypothetical protein
VPAEDQLNFSKSGKSEDVRESLQPSADQRSPDKPKTFDGLLVADVPAHADFLPINITSPRAINSDRPIFAFFAIASTGSQQSKYLTRIYMMHRMKTRH